MIRQTASFLVILGLMTPAMAQVPGLTPQPSEIKAPELTAGPVGDLNISPQALSKSAKAKAPGLSEGVAALVNDDIISTFDLSQRTLLLIATSGVKPTQENIAAIEQQALRALIDEHLQMQELKRFDVKVEEKEIDSEIDQMARQNNITRAQLLANLSQNGIGAQTLRDQVRADVGWSDLVGGRFGKRARVGDAQVDSFLQRISETNAKTQYLVGEVFIDATTAGGMDQAMAGAEQLFTQIQQGAPFQAVARQFSAAPSAASGGDAGWLISGEIDPNLQAALEHMTAGQMSRPVKTDDGVYILYLREVRAGGGRPVVSLKQAAIKLPADAGAEAISKAQATLAQISGNVKSCSGIDSLAAKYPGVVVTDLGDADVSELSPAVAQAIANVNPGQASAPLKTRSGLDVIAVCSRHLAGDNIPSRDQVADHLYSTQLGMLARRYMRDLRNSATIETK